MLTHITCGTFFHISWFTSWRFNVHSCGDGRAKILMTNKICHPSRVTASPSTSHLWFLRAHQPHIIYASFLCSGALKDSVFIVLSDNYFPAETRTTVAKNNDLCGAPLRSLLTSRALKELKSFAIHPSYSTQWEVQTKQSTQPIHHLRSGRRRHCSTHSEVLNVSHGKWRTFENTEVVV